ncbi:MAG: hypothetical protein PHY47_10465 [Lachnospiraceae bacterium]|nr:hypothetical protein [Lachnospiraceae bacterium]
MSISKKDTQLLIGLSGLLIAVLVFWFLYKPLTEKTEVLRNENVQLTARVAQLEQMAANESNYKSETQRMNNELTQTYNLFPSNVLTEDVIYLALNQEIVAPLTVQGIAIDASAQIYAVSQNSISQNSISQNAVSENAVPEGNPSNVVLFNQPATFSYQSSYEGFKRSLDNICNNQNRMTIESVTAAYDNTTGLLTGSTKVNMYYLTGTGKGYIAPDFSNVPVGTNNLFGTVSIPSENTSVSTNEVDD